MNEMASLETALDSDSVASVHATNGSSSSVTGAFEHRCNGTVVAVNRMSAPECGSDIVGLSLHKSRTSSSLDDVNESQFYKNIIGSVSLRNDIRLYTSTCTGLILQNKTLNTYKRCSDACNVIQYKQAKA